MPTITTSKRCCATGHFLSPIKQVKFRQGRCLSGGVSGTKSPMCYGLASSINSAEERRGWLSKSLRFGSGTQSKSKGQWRHPLPQQ